ncbi:MAG: NAD(P)H-dependent oxidoreductase [Acetobacteraceae bacterium]
MQVLIVHAHPEPQSFNGAMTRTAQQVLGDQGHQVTVSDLYAMNFHAASDRSNFASVADAGYFKPQAEESNASEHGGFAPELEAEIRKLESADLLIFQFPIWWFGLPAILKGWVDRVFVMGRIYGGGRVYETGRFRGRRAMLSLTTGAPPETWVSGGRHGDIDAILRPIHRGIFQFVGYDVLRPQLSCSPARVSDEERATMLTAWRVRAAGLFAETPMDVGEY